MKYNIIYYNILCNLHRKPQVTRNFATLTTFGFDNKKFSP